MDRRGRSARDRAVEQRHDGAERRERRADERQREPEVRASALLDGAEPGRGQEGPQGPDRRRRQGQGHGARVAREAGGQDRGPGGQREQARGEHGGERRLAAARPQDGEAQEHPLAGDGPGGRGSDHGPAGDRRNGRPVRQRRGIRGVDPVRARRPGGAGEGGGERQGGGDQSGPTAAPVGHGRVADQRGAGDAAREVGGEEPRDAALRARQERQEHPLGETGEGQQEQRDRARDPRARWTLAELHEQSGHRAGCERRGHAGGAEPAPRSAARAPGGVRRPGPSRRRRPPSRGRSRARSRPTGPPRRAPRPRDRDPRPPRAPRRRASRAAPMRSTPRRGLGRRERLVGRGPHSGARINASRVASSPSTRATSASVRMCSSFCERGITSSTTSRAGWPSMASNASARLAADDAHAGQHAVDAVDGRMRDRDAALHAGRHRALAGDHLPQDLRPQPRAARARSPPGARRAAGSRPTCPGDRRRPGGRGAGAAGRGPWGCVRRIPARKAEKDTFAEQSDHQSHRGSRAVSPREEPPVEGVGRRPRAALLARPRARLTGPRARPRVPPKFGDRA